MNHSPSQPSHTLLADLKTLHRQLEELFARSKEDDASKDHVRELGPPTLFIRGK
jgi:hypothetical protein